MTVVKLVLVLFHFDLFFNDIGTYCCAVGHEGMLPSKLQLWMLSPLLVLHPVAELTHSGWKCSAHGSAHHGVLLQSAFLVGHSNLLLVFFSSSSPSVYCASSSSIPWDSWVTLGKKRTLLYAELALLVSFLVTGKCSFVSHHGMLCCSVYTCAPPPTQHSFHLGWHFASVCTKQGI